MKYTYIFGVHVALEELEFVKSLNKSFKDFGVPLGFGGDAKVIEISINVSKKLNVEQRKQMEIALFKSTKEIYAKNDTSLNVTDVKFIKVLEK